MGDPLGDLTRALGLYRGSLLRDDSDIACAAIRREALRTLFVRSLIREGRRLEKMEDPGGAMHLSNLFTGPYD
jgi:hypothetical protein